MKTISILALAFAFCACGPCGQKKKNLAIVPVEPTTVADSTKTILKDDPTIRYRFKIGDKVCVMEKFSGYIVGRKPSAHEDYPNVYTIEYVDGNGKIVSDAEFYEPELKRGGC